MVKILISPNAFKGSLGSIEVAEALRDRLNTSTDVVRSFPIADGGDDTLPVFVRVFGGQKFSAKVTDPLGRPRTAGWGLLNSKIAVVEMAEANGIRVLKRSELDPMKTSTFGTGQLISHIVDSGIKEILLGIGGSATVDGGTGILKALGATFYEKSGNEISNGNLLIGLKEIDIDRCMKKMQGINVTVLSDVENPLLGKNGAAKIFGPQKGATIEMVEELEKAMRNFSKLVFKKTNKDYTNSKGTGAAGGIGYTFKSLFGSQIVNGMEYLINNSNLNDLICWSDVVITGEGKLDNQSLQGKGSVQIARLAKKHNKSCLAVCGIYEPSKEMDMLFDKIFSLTDYEPDKEKAIKNVRHLLIKAGSDIAQFLSLIFR